MMGLPNMCTRRVCHSRISGCVTPASQAVVSTQTSSPVQCRLGRQSVTCHRLCAGGDDPYSCLTSADEDVASDALPDSLPPLRLSTLLGSPAEDADAARSAVAARQAGLLAAVRLIGRLASVLRDTPAFPELFGPARRALEALAARQGLHKVCRIHHLPPGFVMHTLSSCWRKVAVWSGKLLRG